MHDEEIETLQPKLSRELQTWADSISGKLGGRDLQLTVADAATRTGLTLEQSEKALNWLIDDYRGRLAVGEQGDLIFRFPNGFTKPWKTRETITEALERLGRAALPVLKVLVKIWILVVIVLYVALFVAILLGILFASKGKGDDRSDRRSSRSSFGTFMLFRLVFDLLQDALWAIFWYRRGSYNRRSLDSRRDEPRQRLYEGVFSFIFGPETEKKDALAERKKLLSFIRSRNGRVVVSDIVALLACTNAKAEQILTRLMVDYEGDVTVDDGGSIIFSFTGLRKTVSKTDMERLPMSWDEPEIVPPLTDNTTKMNLAVAALNGFNLVMSAFAMTQNLVLENLPLLFQGIPLSQLPDKGFPIFLGIIPFFFSAFIFTIPAIRWFRQKKQIVQASLGNGLRAILFHVLGKDRYKIQRNNLAQFFSNAFTITGQKPQSPTHFLAAADQFGDVKANASIANEKVFNNLTLDLEADLDIDDAGETWYSFNRYKNEQEAVKKARRSASDKETTPGDIVFS